MLFGYLMEIRDVCNKTNLAVEVERARVARVWSVLLAMLPAGVSLFDAFNSVLRAGSGWVLAALTDGEESEGLR